MQVNNSYPNRPVRPNFTDIRTIQIFDPIVIGQSAATTKFAALSATGATLENGVRIKNTSPAGTLAIGVTGPYPDGLNTVGNSTGGFELLPSEELFIEVRDLSKLLIRGTTSATACWIAS